MGNSNFEVKRMYNFNSEYNVGNGYVVNHIPILVSQHDYGIPLFGEDPGSIIDELQYEDQIDKLTR